ARGHERLAAEGLPRRPPAAPAGRPEGGLRGGRAAAVRRRADPPPARPPRPLAGGPTPRLAPPRRPRPEGGLDPAAPDRPRTPPHRPRRAPGGLTGPGGASPLPWFLQFFVARGWHGVC